MSNVVVVVVLYFSALFLRGITKPTPKNLLLPRSKEIASFFFLSRSIAGQTERAQQSQRKSIWRESKRVYDEHNSGFHLKTIQYTPLCSAVWMFFNTSMPSINMWIKCWCYYCCRRDWWTDWWSPRSISSRTIYFNENKILKKKTERSFIFQSVL